MLLCITMLLGILPPMTAGAAITLADKLTVNEVTAFERRNPMSQTMAGVFLTDLTSGEMIASKNSTMLTSATELNEWLLLLYALRNADFEEKVTVTKAMLDEAKKAQYPILAGLKEKDVLTVEQLLRLFMMSRADDVRCTLVMAVAGSEKRAVSIICLTLP